MENKVVLITGGTGKLGRLFVKHFADRGYKVIFTSRHRTKIDKLCEELKHLKSKLFGIEVDFLERNFTEKIISFIEEFKIFPEVLINNARNLENLKLETAVPERKQWLNEFLIDVVAPYEISIALAYHPNSKLKNIVNISSIYGVVAANPNLYENPQLESPIHYSVAKSALIHLTKELAVRLADKGIRVNCVSYGGVEGRVDEGFQKRYSNFCPSGRMLSESEVVGAVEFLVSDGASGITGHNLIVDGGWTIW